MKTYKEITEGTFGNETTKSKELALLLDKAINKVDSSLSYKNLSLAISLILENNYGKHNYEVFIQDLKNNLKIK